MLPGETILSGASPTCEVCGKLYEFRVMQSRGGWYIGSECCVGPNTRESRYFNDSDEAEVALVGWAHGVMVGART